MSAMEVVINDSGFVVVNINFGQDSYLAQGIGEEGWSMASQLKGAAIFNDKEFAMVCFAEAKASFVDDEINPFLRPGWQVRPVKLQVSFDSITS